MKILLALPIIGLALGLVRAAVETVNSEVVVDSVERHIDLTSQLVKINAKIKLSNNGPGAIKSFHYAVGLVEGTETIVFMVLCLLFPNLFIYFSFIFIILCLITIVFRIIVCYKELS